MVWANARSAHWPTPSLRSLGAAEPPPRPARVLSLGHFLRASARQRRPGEICIEGKWAAGIYTQNQLEPVRGSAAPGICFAGKWAAGICTQNELEPVRGSAVPGKKFCGKM